MFRLRRFQTLKLLWLVVMVPTLACAIFSDFEIQIVTIVAELSMAIKIREWNEVAYKIVEKQWEAVYRNHRM